MRRETGAVQKRRLARPFGKMNFSHGTLTSAEVWATNCRNQPVVQLFRWGYNNGWGGVRCFHTASIYKYANVAITWCVNLVMIWHTHTKNKQPPAHCFIRYPRIIPWRGLLVGGWTRHSKMYQQIAEWLPLWIKWMLLHSEMWGDACYNRLVVRRAFIICWLSSGIY